MFAAPDHADPLVRDCLPALHDILEDVHRSSEVYISALSLLANISNESAYSLLIVESGIVPCVVQWLSPQHTNQNLQCRLHIFRITQSIAQHSDHGRKALIDSKVLPVLLRLINDRVASNVINGCQILNALAQTGTYREELLAAKIRDPLERITSYFRQSKLETKAEKQTIKAQAKQVILTLNSTRSSGPAIQQNGMPTFPHPLSNRLSRSRLSIHPPEETFSPPVLRRSASEADVGQTDAGIRRDSVDPPSGRPRHARYASLPNNQLATLREEHARHDSAGAPEARAENYSGATRRGLLPSSHPGSPSYVNEGSIDSGLRSVRPPATDETDVIVPDSHSHEAVVSHQSLVLSRRPLQLDDESIDNGLQRSGPPSYRTASFRIANRVE